MSMCSKIIDNFLSRKLKEKKQEINNEVEQLLKKAKINKKDILLSLVPLFGIIQIDNIKDRCLINNKEYDSICKEVNINFIFKCDVFVLLFSIFQLGIFFLPLQIIAAKSISVFFLISFLIVSIIKIKRLAKIKKITKQEKLKKIIQQSIENDLKNKVITQRLNNKDYERVKSKFEKEFLLIFLAKRNRVMTYNCLYSIEKEYEDFKIYKKYKETADNVLLNINDTEEDIVFHTKDVSKSLQNNKVDIYEYS